jgi:hypothetical protein
MEDSLLKTYSVHTTFGSLDVPNWLFWPFSIMTGLIMFYGVIYVFFKKEQILDTVIKFLNCK